MDAYDFSEAVGVLAQLDKAFWDGVGSAKWSERRDALQRLKAMASTPKVRRLRSVAWHRKHSTA